ncbi:hypothetical protein U1Q18_008642 [Sarracenia purpurea var. burkii]
MMKVAGVVVIAWMVVGALVEVVPHADAAGITCGTVVSKLSPCASYLQKGGAASRPCCNGVRTLNAQARSKPDRQAACKCIKSLVTSIRGRNTYALASSLAGKCNVNLPYKLTPNFDCSIVR